MKNKMLPEMRRRDFLAYGSSGALSLALMASRVGAQSGDASRILPTDAHAAELVSVGYLPGSAHLARAEQSVGASEGPDVDTRIVPTDPMPAHVPLHHHLIAAEKLPEGDPRFAHTGARLSIHGLFPSEAFKIYPELTFWAIDVEFKCLTCTPMFYAWCFQNTIVPQSSSPAPFIMPIVDALNLTLSFKHTPQDQAAGIESMETSPTCQQQVCLQFGLGRERNVPKLRRGVYFIALPRARTGLLPRWSEYQLRSAAPGNPDLATELYRRHGRRDEQESVDFAYVKLVVDYAEKTSAVRV